MLNFMRNIS